MSDITQTIGLILIFLSMLLAYIQLFSKKLYIQQTRIFRAVWFMVSALILGVMLF